MTDINDLINDFRTAMTAAVKALPMYTAEQLGLDKRSGNRLFVDGENRTIYVHASELRALDYYGGFEYVKENDGRENIGDFVRFDGYESERVQECFDFLNDTE